jgi:chitin disaccharide deacetylase
VETSEVQVPANSKKGALIINADDWGGSSEVTDRILDCVLARVVSSASAMVFMEDSERAATLALEHNVDTGLHLNLTTPFESSACPPVLKENQLKITAYLRGGRLNRAFYNTRLAGTFEYVVKAQLDEYARLYRKPLRRADGHHHMHLCANVQRQGLLPEGIIVRRNFSLSKGEKSVINRIYRDWQDRRIAQRHRISDFFFSLPPTDVPSRLEKIFALATESTVEVETHPVNQAEFEFLMHGDRMNTARKIGIATSYSLGEEQ